MRDKLLEDLSPLLSELMNKAKAGRFQGNIETHKLRISYVNALSNLLRAYNQLLKDKEVEDLENQIMELYDAINQQTKKGNWNFKRQNS